ncbi:glycosyltransferase family 4 protein [Candidatus Pacebacteria bacterium]|nr:glycosyltransferase family 4 protein [Candidatus Paceibacterota bacterium]
MEEQKEKICFVLQQHTKGTHMDYVYEMARTLRHDENLPLTLFLEKGGCREEDKAWCVAQSFRFAPLRIFENVYMLLKMRMNGYKIFYVHYSFVSAVSAGIITKLFGGTVYYWNCGMPWNYKRSFMESAYQKLAYKLIDYLVTGADAIVDGYVSYYGLKKEQVKVIPNWIDLEHIKKDPSARQNVATRLGIPDDAKILLFVHKLAKRKGAHLLPEILEEVSDRNVHLVVAGDGDQRDAIKKQSDLLGLTSRVHMLGYVGRNEVQELLQGTDLFVMPSEEEGSPHSLIEAMAYGLPFVSFDVGGVKETAPPEAAPYIYEYGDTKRMASGIDILLKDQAKYSSFQTSERMWVQNFSKQIITQKFKSLLS